MLVLAPLGVVATLFIGAAAGGVIGGLLALIGCGFAPPMMVAGLYLIAVPGPDAQLNNDFADWFEEQPKGHRTRIYICAGVGMIISALLIVITFSIAYERFSEIFDIAF